MLLTYDLDIGQWVISPGIKQSPPIPRFIRGDTPDVDVQFCRGGTVVSMGTGPASATWRFGLKKRTVREGAYLVYTTSAVSTGWATLSTSLTGSNNDLVFTAVDEGTAGDSITLAYVDPLANSASLSVSVSSSAITVNLATDSGGAITSTAALIKTAIEASAAASALVTVAHKSGNDGTGAVTALAATALSGGADARYTFAPNFSTSELNTALNKDGNTGNDLLQVEAVLEVEATVGSVVTSTVPLDVLVLHDVNQGEEDAPTTVTTAQGGRTAISSGVRYVDVTFASPFAAAPILTGMPGVEMGSPSDEEIWVTGVASLTATGFRAYLSATTTNADYKLHWYARPT